MKVNRCCCTQSDCSWGELVPTRHFTTSVWSWLRVPSVPSQIGSPYEKRWEGTCTETGLWSTMPHTDWHFHLHWNMLLSDTW